MQIQISWLLQKPTDLDLHCLQMQGISVFSMKRVKCLNTWACLNVYTGKYLKISYTKVSDKMAYNANSVDPDQTALEGAV